MEPERLPEAAVSIAPYGLGAVKRAELPPGTHQTVTSLQNCCLLQMASCI